MTLVDARCANGYRARHVGWRRPVLGTWSTHHTEWLCTTHSKRGANIARRKRTRDKVQIRRVEARTFAFEKVGAVVNLR